MQVKNTDMLTVHDERETIIMVRKNNCNYLHFHDSFLMIIFFNIYIKDRNNDNDTSIYIYIM